MNRTVEVLKTEAWRLRSLAERIEAFAHELEAEPQETAESSNQTHMPWSERSRNSTKGEFSDMTQQQAIIAALKQGPLSTRDLFERLNAGGKHFRKPVYVTAVVGRMKDKLERTENGKLALKP